MAPRVDAARADLDKQDAALPLRREYLQRLGISDIYSSPFFQAGAASTHGYDVADHNRINAALGGEEGYRAFVAGLRYGEGWLYTRDSGRHKVFWQGPSIGYDAGADGSKVMVLIYNLRDPYDIYHRFTGVDGSADLPSNDSLLGVEVAFDNRSRCY